MSFKEDVKNIELPKELHERSKKGIKSAELEKKKINLKPAILTFIVTAAMLLFVFSQLNGGHSTDVTSAALKDNGMPPIAISIAYIVTVVAIIGVIFLWRKKRVSRLLLILTFMALMSTTWITSLKYTYELLDTEIYPISKEIVWENNNIIDYIYLSIDYMQPKPKAPIKQFYLNDKNYSIYHYNDQTAIQPLPFRLFNEFTNALIIIPIEDIPDLINDEPIQARVLFADYTQMDVAVELFTFINQSERNVSINTLYDEVTEHSWIGTNEIHLLKDTYIEQVQFPKRIVGIGSWKLAINNEVIQDGPISTERFDLLRTISKDDVITLSYEIPKKLNVPLDGMIYFIENNQKINVANLSNGATITKSYIQYIVKKQRGEQREN